MGQVAPPLLNRFGQISLRLILDFNTSSGPYSLRAVALTGYQHYWQDNLIDQPRGFYVDAARRLGRRFVLRANHEYVEENSRLRNGNNATTIRDNTARDPRVGVTLDDLLVPSVRTNPTSPRVPLTLTMLRTDPTTGYRANLDPTSGRITNSAALLLTTPGVATGLVGRPITQHQLGYVAPNNGIYTVFTPGDKTTPNAGFTTSGNTNYEFSSGRLKGMSVGGTVQWQRQIRQGYTDVGGVHQLYFRPDFVRVDLRLGFRVKVQRTTWNLQLTTQNLFDTQPVEKTLATTGALTLASINQVPRTFVLSSSLRS